MKYKKKVVSHKTKRNNPLSAQKFSILELNTVVIRNYSFILFQFNTNNLPQVDGFKYSYRLQKIFKQIYLTQEVMGVKRYSTYPGLQLELGVRNSLVSYPRQLILLGEGFTLLQEIQSAYFKPRQQGYTVTPSTRGKKISF